MRFQSVSLRRLEEWRSEGWGSECAAAVRRGLRNKWRGPAYQGQKQLS